jgi:hypothetical protein
LCLAIESSCISDASILSTTTDITYIYVNPTAATRNVTHKIWLPIITKSIKVKIFIPW